MAITAEFVPTDAVSIHSRTLDGWGGLRGEKLLDQLVGIGIGSANAHPFGQVGGGDHRRSQQTAAEQRQDGTWGRLEYGG